MTLSHPQPFPSTLKDPITFTLAHHFLTLHLHSLQDGIIVECLALWCFDTASTFGSTCQATDGTDTFVQETVIEGKGRHLFHTQTLMGLRTKRIGRLASATDKATTEFATFLIVFVRDTTATQMFLTIDRQTRVGNATQTFFRVGATADTIGTVTGGVTTNGAAAQGSSRHDDGEWMDRVVGKSRMELCCS